MAGGLADAQATAAAVADTAVTVAMLSDGAVGIVRGPDVLQAAVAAVATAAAADGPVAVDGFLVSP